MFSLDKLKLSSHLLILFFFMAIIALIMGNLTLQVMHRLENRILDIENTDSPLILAVSEASRLQMNQAMRMNEILLYANVDDRQNFEVANDGFIRAGKQMVDVLVATRHIVQKNLEMPSSNTVKNQLEKIKAALNDMEKIHASYEHLGGSIIRSQFKFRFLTKAGIITGNAIQAPEQSEKEYLQTLSKNTSELDDETKRLEAKIKEAFYLTKDMIRNLPEQAASVHHMALVLYIACMAFLTIGGLFLVLFIYKINNARTKELSDTLESLSLPFQEHVASLLKNIQHLDATLSRLFTANSQWQETADSSEISLTRLETLSHGTIRSNMETLALVQENARRLSDSDRLIAVFAEVSTKSMALGEQIQKGAQHLSQFAMQMHLLATSASAEASRTETSRGFVVFTEELKHMAQKVIHSAEEIAEAAQMTVRDLRSGHEGVDGARKLFQDIANVEERLKTETNSVIATSQQHSEMVRSVHKNTVSLREGFTVYSKLIAESEDACRMFRDQTDAIAELLQEMLATLDERQHLIEQGVTNSDLPEIPGAIQPPRKTFENDAVKVTNGVLHGDSESAEKH